MCRGYFSSQEIDTHHATEHRSTDQSRNGCRMCCFCHAQPFEITRAKNLAYEEDRPFSRYLLNRTDRDCARPVVRPPRARSDRDIPSSVLGCPSDPLVSCLEFIDPARFYGQV